VSICDYSDLATYGAEWPVLGFRRFDLHLGRDARIVECVGISGEHLESKSGVQSDICWLSPSMLKQGMTLLPYP
jgi:hypothetical protein